VPALADLHPKSRHRRSKEDAAPAGGLAVRPGVVALVGNDSARPDVRADVEQGLELRAVAGLAAGQMEVERMAVEIGLQMDLAREAATRAAEGLAILPPFAPAAETWARTTVLSNICTRCALPLLSASRWKNASKVPFRLSRQNRFQTLFQLPYAAGSARQVMLCTEKKCRASRNLRSSRPLSPRPARAARNSATASAQSSSVIVVSMAGSR
jgi:hypothetical protein